MPARDDRQPSTIPHGAAVASPWVVRFAPLIRARGIVLDLACGRGRHARFLAARGCDVLAVDRDAEALAGLADSGVRTLCADLEQGAWPLPGLRFDAIVVTNYLHRPQFPHLLAALAPDGVLIYETFADGNARFGKPARPEFLLHPDELLDRFGKALRVVAFEQGEVAQPAPAVVQRICGVGLERAWPPGPIG
jgi:SAM-dependent methyltransferase